ncbi:MAG: ABC transporter permease subunit [Candidatus Obscuribacter sp.]|jgi:ABC-type amino acid transport system permease subunit|nr:ABC transporter permease subunit [Candidatus Obscuribacter sp.]
MSSIDILFRYQQAFSDGLATTFRLVMLIWFIGLGFGTILGVAGAKWKVSIGLPSQALSFILSGMPILVFLFWLHYPLQVMLGVVIDPFYTAVATLATINIFAVADVVRGVLSDFPKQYVTAAQVCGMNQTQIILHIQLPIILRQTIPVVLMIQVNMLQATLFASLISVNEIFRVAQQINSQIYRPVEIYTALGFLFLAICLPINGVATLLKIKFTRDFSER